MILQEEYNLNLESQLSKKHVKVSQYDTGRRLLITLLKNDCSMFKIPSEASASINGLKPDGKGFRYECSIENNKVVVDMKEQMTVLAGCVKCEILLSKGGERIATANFMLSVEESPLSENTPISSTDIPLLQKAIEASEIVLSVEKTVKGYSESASKSAQSSQASAESAVNASNASAESANSASQSATNASAKATEAKKSETNAKLSETNASNSAKKAQTSADSAIQTKAEIEQLKKETIEQASTLTDSAKQEISTVKDATVTEVTELKNSTVSEITTLKDSTIEAVTLLKDSAKAEADRATESSASAKVQAEKAEASADSIANVTSDVEKLKEDLPNKITKFYASNQGETHITDSDNGKIQDMMLYGESEQFTTTGKNLLKIRDGTQTLRGVTVTAKDGVVALKGTATETGWTILDIDSFVLDGRYTLSSNSTNIVGVVLASKTFKTVIQHNKPATLENEEVSKICFTITNGKTYNVSNVLIQLEKGSEATSYEPYTGGAPSPSPNYPQEIKSVVNPTIKLLGSNILKIADGEYQDGGVTTTVSNGVVKIKGTANRYLDIQLTANNTFVFKEGTKLIFSSNNVKGIENKNDSYLDFTNNNTIGFSIMSNNLNTPYIIKESDAKYPFILFIRCHAGKTYDETWKPQVLIGETITPYKPYTEQTITLPITLNAIPVSSGGNVTINGQQYVSDRVVEKGGVFGIERNIREIHTNTKTMNNSDEYPGWNKVKGITDTTYYSEKPVGTARVLTFICNFTQSIFKNNNIETNNILFWLKDAVGYSQSELIAKAIDIDMYIRLQDAIFEPLPEDIQVKLRSLTTYYPVTHITVGSDELDGYTVFNYPISLANGWNYVKQQLNDNRDYIYDMDLQSAEAYVNSEYAVTLTELEV